MKFNWQSIVILVLMALMVVSSIRSCVADKRNAKFQDKMNAITDSILILNHIQNELVKQHNDIAKDTNNIKKDHAKLINRPITDRQSDSLLRAVYTKGQERFN